MGDVKRVGVIGGGQLAWMMATAAEKLGVELVVQTPSNSDPAVAIAADAIFAPVADATATAQLATQCDVITFENEFVDLEALSLLESQGICFRPGLQTLRPLLDKYHQRCYLRDLGLPTPGFFPLPPPPSPLPSPSLPLVLKTRRHGYDGQGTFIIKDLPELNTTLERLKNVLLLVEEFVPFERELAAIAARSVNGDISIYPIVETQQEQQVCRRVFAPAKISSAVGEQVNAIARTLLNHLQVVGVFGIELFLTQEERVLVNEIAPRVHNSGHFTLDACETSQFEQHLRAVCGLPLGSPAMKIPGAVMVNLLGYEHSTSSYLEQRQQIAALPGAHVHWYGKTESRPGRKLGHVTVLLEAEEGKQGGASAIAQKVESIWYGREKSC
ncbi:MAG: 5-(carboxyamino)imidazole ribonucleotide synthase [Leptolyngbyaceae cyanobacterium HOT.MB2.61]|nr:5-(carboxyamino)imidazole ribonucleotide synthase [Leptolyngbyaceae cyanobacterium HOT.MB2.61]